VTTETRLTITLDLTDVGETPQTVGSCPVCGGPLRAWRQWGCPVIQCGNIAHPRLRGEALSAGAGDGAAATAPSQDGEQLRLSEYTAAPPPPTPPATAPAPSASPAPASASGGNVVRFGLVEAVPIETSRGKYYQSLARCKAHGFSHWYARITEAGLTPWRHKTVSGETCTMAEPPAPE
jgi:hypothetical protein